VKGYLAVLGPGGVLAGGTGHLKPKIFMQAQGVQLLGVQNPLLALGHAQEPILGIEFDGILEDVVALLCTELDTAVWPS